MRSTLLLLLILSGTLSTGERPRLVVTTDVGGDPDDTQSLIRLMLYANEFEIEALVASASGTPGELKETVVRPDLIRQVVDAYDEVQAHLASHAEGYPTAAELRDVIVPGNPRRGREHVGEGHDTPASRRIIEIVDRDDLRPVNIAIWGGQTDLAQALWRVRADRGEDGLKEFVARLRVYDISDQDGIAAWMLDEFPGLFYILAKAPKGKDKRIGAYRGMYLDGDESLTSRDWIDEHVRTNHGPLGALYPTRTWTAPNPHGVLKEGDTPSWFYFLPRGLNDPTHPEWGGWGGRFEPTGDGRFYRDAQDTADGETSARMTVARWRPYFQNEFQARMDWCVAAPDEVNHRPRAVIDGDATRNALHRKAKPGEAVPLIASGSADPDGDRLTYVWRIYPEAGTYRGDVTVLNEKPEVAEVRVPDAAADKTIHVLLEVTDDGQPPLTAFRRVVIEAADKPR
ncbi:MAG: nucleoside hydrolase-like domain-containing protein [Planctomycetaceae bacterium]